MLLPNWVKSLLARVTALEESGGSPVVPHHAEIALAHLTQTTGTTAAALFDTYGEYIQPATPANGQVLLGSFALRAGTYKLTVVGFSNPDFGRTDIKIDGAVVATFDWYAGSFARSIKTEASVAITGDIVHKLEVVVNGQNGSSVGYSYGLIRLIMSNSSEGT